MLTIIETTLVYTLLLGSLYLLVSIGFSLICGVLRIFHLGYAYIFVATIYLTWLFFHTLGLPLWLSITLMVVVQAGIAIAIYKGIIAKYLKMEEKIITGLLLIAIISEQAANRWFPIQSAVNLPTTIIPGSIAVASTNISIQLLLAAAVGIVVTAIFVLFFLFTKTGLAVRAISYDINSAKIMGIQVEQIYMLIMVLVLLPVIIAMLMIAPVWALDPTMGWGYMITAILISVMGGLGNIRGTIIASYIIGFTHAFASFIIAEPRFMNLLAIAVVIVMLIVRPQGIAKTESLW
ncbi:MAG: branched-chain amino acid ABC transporter permease [Chloroflexi bacterium]|nr:branched-chain amino acid ABC transporter permease [Chloroflexota bacterium]